MWPSATKAAVAEGARRGGPLRGRTAMLVRCCLCFGCSVGLVNDSLSLFTATISAQLGVGIGDFSLVLTIINVANALMTLAMPALLARLPVSVVMGAGVALASIAYGALSVADGLAAFYGTAVVIGIAGCCFSTIPVTTVLQSWYGAKNGLACGIAMGCSGVVGALFSPLVASVIGQAGYRPCLMLLALGFCVLALPSALTMQLGPETITPAQKGREGCGSVSRGIIATLMVLALLLSLGLALCGHLSVLGLDMGFDLTFSSLMVSMSMVSNVVCKTGLGALADRMGALEATALAALAAAGGIALLLVAPGVAVAALLGSFLLGASAACHTVGMTLVCQRVAAADCARVFSWVTVALCLGYALCIWFLGAVRDAAGGYGPALVIAAAACCAAAGLCAGLRRVSSGAVDGLPAA